MKAETKKHQLLQIELKENSMFKLNITEKAENDLLENAIYIKNVLHSDIAANNLIDGFYNSLYVFKA